MARPSENYSPQIAEIAAPARVLKVFCAAARRAFAAAEDALAAFFFWHGVSRKIERLLALDDAALQRLGIARNEIVPTVCREARARRRRSSHPDKALTS
jgi:hypothetical protein